MDKSFEDRRFYVYVYLDPRKPGNYEYGPYHFDYEPFYIGKGCGSRILYHLRIAKYTNEKNKKFNKIRKILKLGMMPIIYKFVENIGNKPALDLEYDMILTIGDRNSKTGPLLNIDKTKGFGVLRSGRIPWNKGLTKEDSPSIMSTSVKLTGIKRNTTWIKGLSKYTDDRVLKMANDKKGKPSLNSLKYKTEEEIFHHYKINKDDFYNLYNKGDWPNRIARELNTSLSTILSIHERLKLKLNGSSEGKAKLNYQYVPVLEETIDNIVNDYVNNNFTMKMLILKYNLSKNVLRKRLLDRGIKLITFAERVKGKTIKEYKEFEK